ncbi:hypothetical protein HYN48_06700 [Flavobacterium magnum]|uniref:Glycosyltransferase RgtA/B/C/D-like domain-containing protein n=1 Tax=Flavobacterium magnum TaxID=2162713 RepID=A0A2S0RES4_9FLAO|nr:hypothetical protein [Flavobacterium magnum]AWA29790.1 hypothetical protein HYN48_06700 [Flavobacterium magnum]
MTRFLQKAYPVLNIAFLLANLVFQAVFFNTFFLNEGLNGDERGYLSQLSGGHFSWSFISGSFSQPYTFLSSLLHLAIADPMLCNRLVSLIMGICLIAYLFFFFKKRKSAVFTEGNPFWDNVALLNILIAVITIVRSHLVGTSDMTSTCFAVPGFIMLTEVITKQAAARKLWVVGLLFALSFTARPTFLVVMLAFLIALLFFYRKTLWGKPLIVTGLFFMLFTALINLYPLMEKGTITIDTKEIPESIGTSWFEMNYLMAKKWDSGALPRTQWLSDTDVMAFKKEHPDFVFPRNQFDLLAREPGLYIRQMVRMGVISIYTSFRYLYLLFPFLLVFPFLKRRPGDQRRIAGFIAAFYVITLFLFMFFSVKMMEFRWMHILLAVFVFYAMHLIRMVPQKTRLLILDGSFLTGTLFIFLALLRGV